MSTNTYVPPQANPTITTNAISSWIVNGNGFIATYQAASATNANLRLCAFSLFNPSNSGKSVIIYSIRINSESSDMSTDDAVMITTSNPSGTTGYTGTITASNQGAGTTSSVVSLSSTATGATASVTTVGTAVDYFASNGNVSTELLSNGAIYFLPNGSAKGIAIFEHVGTAGNNFGATVRWIEY